VEVAVSGPSGTRVTRAPLPPTKRKGLVLTDAAPLHVSVFDRCVLTNGEDLSAALAALPDEVALDAARLFAEWAAWLGAPDASAVASMCLGGSCVPLADRLTHRP
jgi:hypothetical protein